MHCNGRFRPLLDPPKRGSRKKAEPQAASLEHPRQASNTLDPDVSSHNGDADLDSKTIACVERELGIRSSHAPSISGGETGQPNVQSPPSRGPAKGQERPP